MSVGYPLENPARVNWDYQVVLLPFTDLVAAHRWRASGLIDAPWSPWVAFDALSTVIAPGIYQLGDNSTIGHDISKPTLMNLSSAYRQSFKGITIVPDMNSLNNEGIVTAGQWGLETQKLPLAASTAVPPPDGTHVLEHILVKGIPSTSTGIVSACANAGSWRAEKGVYIPMRFDQPNHLYVSGVGNTYPIPVEGREEMVETGYPVLIQSPDSVDADGNLDYGKSVISTGVGIQIFTTAGEINQNTGVIMFTNLAASTALQIKIRTGVELVALPNTAYASVQTVAPLKDQLALDAVQNIQTRLPVAYEAAFNSKGKILPWIMDAAKKILPIVAPWLAGKFAGRNSTPKAPGKAVYIEEDVD